MYPQRSASQTDFGISFLLDKNAAQFILYSYPSSIIHDELTPAQINELPEKIEAIYRVKLWSNTQIMAATGTLALFCAFFGPPVLTEMNPFRLVRVVAIGIGIIGCIDFYKERKRYNQIQELIDTENQTLVEKELRWCLPRDSQTLELHTNYKFHKMNPSIRDGEAMSSPSASSGLHQDNKIFRSSPAINDGDIGNATNYPRFPLILF